MNVYYFYDGWEQRIMMANQQGGYYLRQAIRNDLSWEAVL